MSQRMAERPAGMNLDWHNTGVDTWQADLPAIPGYTGADGNGSFVTVVYNGNTELAVPYDADCTIFLSQGGVVNLNLWDMWAFDPFGPDAKDVMQAVDELGAVDISHQLESMGYEPVVDEDGYYVVAARKATRRTARMDLNWEFNSNLLLWEAALPALPDYPGVDSVDVWKDDENDRWCFSLCQNGYPLSIRTNDEFGIPSADTAEEMMDAVENLDPQEIADVLAAQGYLSDED